MVVLKGRGVYQDESRHYYGLEQQVLEQLKQIRVCGPFSKF